MQPDEPAPAARTSPPAKRASDELLAEVYTELRALAAAKMASERPDHTLEPTALVHEAWMRLRGSEVVNPDNRTAFFHAAAESMRRILIEHARAKKSLKRGGGRQRLPANLAELAQSEDGGEILAVDEAIQRLSEHDHRAGEVVRLRFFAGLSAAETAQALGVSLRSVQRDWTYARARLASMLAEDGKD